MSKILIKIKQKKNKIKKELWRIKINMKTINKNLNINKEKVIPNTIILNLLKCDLEVGFWC